MLPEIVDEAKIRSFKFWFGDRIQEGMNYQDELFYRLHTADLEYRAKLFHMACRLSQRGARLMLTVSTQSCSLWVSLRSQSVKALTSDSAREEESVPALMQFQDVSLAEDA